MSDETQPSADHTMIPQLSEDDHFDVVMRGYDRRQVDEAVRGLRDRVAEAERRSDDAGAEASAARREVDVLRRRAEGRPPTAEQLGERVAGLLKLAEDESAARRESARAEAEQVTSTAAERARETVATAEKRAADLVARAKERAESIATTAEQRGERRVADAEAQAQRVETEARRRVDNLERHHNDLLQRMGRMRDVLVDLLKTDRVAEEARRPAQPAPRAEQPASRPEPPAAEPRRSAVPPEQPADDSVRIVAPGEARPLQQRSPRVR